MKPLNWIGDSKEQLPGFPPEVIREVGHARDIATPPRELEMIRTRLKRAEQELCSMAARAQVAYSGESAFHARGLPDADHFVLRANLIRKMTELLAERRLSQAQPGDLLHWDEDALATRYAGRITALSFDRLLQALSDLGQDVALRITPAATGKGRLRVAA